jgi:hypothetical protein
MFIPRHPLARSIVLGACLLGWWRPVRGEQPPALPRAQGPSAANGAGYPGAPAARTRPPAPADAPLAVQARRAAERAIPFIERNGTAWIKERNCLACHYAGYMLWSLRDASSAGLAINKGSLAESTIWAMSQPKSHETGNEGAAQILVARDRSVRSPESMEQIDSLRDLIVNNQQQDGSWSPGGQLPAQKRPLSETRQVSTMLCVLGLETLDQPSEQAIKARDKGLAWLKNTPPNQGRPAVSSEWYALRLLIEKKFGEPKEVESLRAQILAAQRPDGGWGWLVADQSDAFGTGVSLYALSHVDGPATHPAIEKAWRFLVETQTDDGSWVVHGTKNGTKNKPHPLSRFWGSAWALLGLSHSLPPQNANRTQTRPGPS